MSRPGDMMALLRSPVGAAGCAALATFVATGWLLGPAKCSDGWASRSIGYRGACSWHGGVDHSHGPIAFTCAAIVAVLVFQRINAPLQRKAAEERRKQVEARKAALREAGLECPSCGAPMARKMARRGVNRGGYFVGCTGYPVCKTARPLTEAEVAKWVEAPSSEAASLRD